MDYNHLKDEGMKEMLEQEIAGLEAQHFQRSNDAGKYSALLAALDSGQFSHLDKRIHTMKAKEWRDQLTSAKADVLTLEISIRTEQAKLAEFSEDIPSDAEDLIG